MWALILTSYSDVTWGHFAAAIGRHTANAEEAKWICSDGCDRRAQWSCLSRKGGKVCSPLGSSLTIEHILEPSIVKTLKFWHHFLTLSVQTLTWTWLPERIWRTRKDEGGRCTVVLWGRRADALRETFRVKSPLSTKGRAARSPNPESPLEEKTSSLMDIILEEKWVKEAERGYKSRLYLSSNQDSEELGRF